MGPRQMKLLCKLAYTELQCSVLNWSFFKQAQRKTGPNLADLGRLLQSKTGSRDSLPWDGGLNRLLNLMPTLDGLQEWQSTLVQYGFAGITPHRPCLRNKWTPHHKRERLAWCHYLCRWRRNQWGNILWSDKSHFNDFYNQRKHVWRRVGERYVPVTIGEYDRYSGGSVLVWAAVSYNHKTDLHIIQGNMKELKYRGEVLISTVPPLVAQTGLTFQNDNAHPHQARIVMDYIQQQGL